MIMAVSGMNLNIFDILVAVRRAIHAINTVQRAIHAISTVPSCGGYKP